METPILERLNPRGREELAAMAVAVQANVAALRVAWSRRVGIPASAHEIRTPPPGPVRRFREILIDRSVIAGYSDEELALRMRQVWGEFVALCWVFEHGDPHRPPDFSALPAGQAMRCPYHVQEKLSQVQRGLWRLRHEQRLRFDPSAAADPEFQQEYEVALSTPMLVYGQNVRTCGNEELLLCACEYAGMLAALRWASDARWDWEADGIMEVTGRGERSGE